ncbi:MAG: DUF4438 domain-containing protein [Nitrosomonas sp.]|nr:MAG: DUF4438 domain-containing protein [Nitrosomonas sp.]
MIRSSRSSPAINRDELVVVAVSGQIAHPVARANPYRIGYDGVPRVLPGTGGIVLNKRIGDLCVGLAGDHIEPGVALHNNSREIIGPRDGPNNALITYACVGNRARVLTGPAIGATGIVTGKHGGVNHVLVDFPSNVLRTLQIGDRIQIESVGLGMRLRLRHDIELMNLSPALLNRWGVTETRNSVRVPVTHRIPARIMGSGLGKNNAWRGDYDIQLADVSTRRRYRLNSLRFGDLVAIVDADNRRGPLYQRGYITIGIIVHGDSTVSGHGPGVTPLMTGPAHCIGIHRDANANLARILNIRQPAIPQAQRTLVERHSPVRFMRATTFPQLAFNTE